MPMKEKSVGEANLSMETYWVFKKQREESEKLPGAQQSCSCAQPVPSKVLINPARSSSV